MSDLFISYSQDDDAAEQRFQDVGWLSYFFKRLTDRLKTLRGDGTTIFRDTKNMRGNSVFWPSIKGALDDCKILLTVLSPTYLRSEWCEQELSYFGAVAERSGGLQIDTYSRVIKIIKLRFPYEGNSFRPVLPKRDGRVLFELLHSPTVVNQTGFQFFGDTETGDPLEFEPGSQFDIMLNAVACAIDKTLIKLETRESPARSVNGAAVAKPVKERSGITIYLADTTSDVAQFRDPLMTELKQHGHTVVSPDDIRAAGHDPDTYESHVTALLGTASIAVHLFGQFYGTVPERFSTSLIERQYRLAGAEAERRRTGFKRISWMPPNLLSAEPRQKALVDELQGDSDFHVVALDDLKTFVHESIARQVEDRRIALEIDRRRREPQIDGPSPQGLRKVYVIRDPADSARAKVIDKWLFELGVEVLTPYNNRDDPDFEAIHEDQLKESDGVLVYNVNEKSLKRIVIDMIRFKPGPPEPPRGNLVYFAPPLDEFKKEYRSHLFRAAVEECERFDPALLRDFVEDLGIPYPHGGAGGLSG